MFLCTKFELNNKNIYVLKYACNQETGEIIDFENINNFETTKIYVDNLNVFYSYLIKLCFRKKYKCVELFKKLHKNTFCFNEKGGLCSTFFVMNAKKQIITFVNFSTKFGVDFSENYQDNKILLDYAIENNRLANSLGTDAFNEFLSTFLKCNKITARELMRENYPVIKNEPLLDIAKNVVAGYQYAKKGKYQNVYSYDITSSYPAVLYNDTPIGKPIHFNSTNETPHTYFYVVRFFASNVKTTKINFLKTKSSSGVFTLTKEMYKLFKKTFTYDYIKELSVVAFKTRKSRFTKFIDKNIQIGKEQEQNPRIKKYNKLLANSIIGYFGRNTQKSYTMAIQTENGFEIKRSEHKIDIVYLPLYLFVLDTAKAQFIKTLELYQDALIYANTDGFLSTKQIPLYELNRDKTNNIGAYKENVVFKDLYIDCVNGYAGVDTSGNIINTLSGMTATDLITPEQYSQKKFCYYINMLNSNGDFVRYTIQRT